MPTIRIPHVAWREGRPRFVPAKTLRDIGYKGRDLKHDDGSWYTRGEAVDWSDAFCRELAARRQAHVARSAAQGPAGHRESPRNPESARGAPPESTRGGAAAAHALSGHRKTNSFYSIRTMFDEWSRSPAFTGGVHAGKRDEAGLRASTVRDYRQKARIIESHDADLYDAQVTALTPQICYGLYEQLWAARGLASARGALVVLGIAIAWARKRGKLPPGFANPAQRLGMKVPEPRVRIAEPGEFAAFVAAADAAGRPDIADMAYLAVWSGQRQADRLALASTLIEGRRHYRQEKTGVPVAIREAPPLTARLEAAGERRREAGVVHPHVILDETCWQPFSGERYRKAFTRIRELAVKSSNALGLAPCPSLAGFRDQDWRDTAVTWLARAGATIPEICAVTGHSLESATSILKHYLARHPELADSAIAKMTAWYAEKVAGR